MKIEITCYYSLLNRAGSTSGEIVLRTDKAYNMVKDIGVTQIEGE